MASLSGSGPGGVSFYLDLIGPDGAALAPGAYEMAARYPFQGTAPGFGYSYANRGCNRITGRFVILEVVHHPAGPLSRLAVDFEQYCDEGPALYGEVRFNSTLPLTMRKPAGSITPDAFAFVAQNTLPLSTPVISNPVTVYGINAPADIAVSGGEYSINGAAFTSAPGTVVNRDRVRLRVMTSANGGTTTSATLDVEGVTATFGATTYTPGQPMSALFYESLAGDFIGQGEMVFGHAPEWAFGAQRRGPSGINVEFQGPGSAYWSLYLATAHGEPLVPGAYELAAREAFRGTSPGLDFYGSGRGCNTLTGRFVVLEANYGPDNVVNSFAANFEQWCEGSTAPLFGEVRFNSAVPLNFLVTSPDSQPDPFALAAQSPVKAASVVESNWFTVYGINEPAPVSITGGRYSLNGGPFTTAPGTAYELDWIVVQLTASPAAGGFAQATLNVGGQVATLAATTYQPGQTLTGLYYRSPQFEFVGRGRTSFEVTPNIVASHVTVNFSNGVSFQFYGLQGTTDYLDFSAPGNVPLTPGTYEGAKRWPFQGSSPGLDFAANGRGCNQLSGRFVVHEVVYAGSVVERFAADFEQDCEMAGRVLVGEVRFNSTVPFSVLLPAAEPPAPIRVAHDFDGDGKSDILIENQASGVVYGWLMNGLSVVSGGYMLSGDDMWVVQKVADLNGDGKADILLRHANGYLYARIMDGLTVTDGGYLLGYDTGWHLVQVADFNGDGKSDILLRHDDGSLYVWLMDGKNIVTGTYLQGAGTGWNPTHVADFNGDGKADILLQHTDGSIYVWQMNGIAIESGTFLKGAGIDWSVTRTGDFNGDGKADILITHTNGGVYLWQMNGTAIQTGTYLLSPGSGWSIAGTADFDGDGKSDILIGHTDGSLYMWTMNGLAISGGGYLLGAGTGWSLQQLLDLNGDGKSDIILRHTDGSLYGWLMNGATIANGTYLMGAGSWRTGP